MFKIHSWQIQNRFRKFTLKKDSWQIQKIFVKIFFCPKYFWNQISLILKPRFTEDSWSKTIPDRFKTDWNFFWIILLDQTFFGPKICLRPKLWVTSIHVQNTFLTDSKQIQKIHIKKNSWHIRDTFKKIWAKQNFVPNIFGTKFLLYLSYDSHKIHTQKPILTDSKQIENCLIILLDQPFLTQNMLKT